MPRRIIKTYKKELKLSNCGFEHEPAEALVRSQWQSRSKSNFYLTYRWIVAIFFILTVINSLVTKKTLHDFSLFFIYLTNWGILLCMTTGIFGAVLVTIWHFNPSFFDNPNRNSDMPTVFKIYWGFHNTALITSFVITIIYWLVLHNDTMPVNLTNILTHACNSAIMFVDILIVGYPLRLYHVIQPIAFGIFYGIFSYIYYLCGGLNVFGKPYIYHVMDWAHPDKAMITIAGTLTLAIFVHMILFWIYKLRVFAQKRMCGKRIILPTTNQKSTLSTSDSRISMVFGTYGNEGFTGSTDKVYPTTQ